MEHDLNWVSQAWSNGEEGAIRETLVKLSIGLPTGIAVYTIFFHPNNLLVVLG